MAIIPVEQGEIYEFITVSGSTNIISQFAGTSDIFPRDIYNWLRISGSASRLQVRTESVFELDESVTAFKRTPLLIGWTDVNTNTHATNTSSFVNISNFKETGSFLQTRGTNDHLVLFASPTSIALGSNYTFTGTPPPRAEIRVVRGDDNTSKITISGSNPSSGPFYFNGIELLSGSFSCTDPYCSITITGLTAGSSKWTVTNAIGNWTSP